MERDFHHGYPIGRRTMICMLLIVVLAIYLEFCQRALPAVVVGTASVIRTMTVISRPAVVTVVVVIIGAPVLGRGDAKAQPDNAYGGRGRRSPAIPMIAIIPTASAEVGRVAAWSSHRRAFS